MATVAHAVVPGIGRERRAVGGDGLQRYDIGCA